MGIIHSVNANSNGGVPKPQINLARLCYNGVEGDKQKDLRYHGGPLRAVCLYSLEKIEMLQAEGHPIDVGTTGENLTIKDFNWDSLEVGMEFSIGDALIELISPAPPCNIIRDSFSDQNSKRISHEDNPGWSRWYAKVLTEGFVEVGDLVVRV
jgi:MOSC domain-containing protein YiiM